MTSLAGAFVVLCLTSLVSAVANGYNKRSGSVFVLSVGDNLLDSRDSLPESGATDLEQVENALLLPNLKKCSYDNIVFVQIPGLQPRELYLYNGLDDISSEATIDTAIAPYVYKKQEYTSLMRTTVKDICAPLKDGGNSKQVKEPRINTVSLPKSRDALFVSQHIERIAREAAAKIDESTLLIVRSEFEDSADAGNPSSPSDANDTPPNSEHEWKMDSVFDKYSFFTPGLFSGLIVTWLLLLILTVALGWTSSLKVSYKAFEPEPKSS